MVPPPELREELMLFGQFVGDWEIDAQHLRPDGSTVREKGELHLGWILNGRGGTRRLDQPRESTGE
jgi:hypothetical protein